MKKPQTVLLAVFAAGASAFADVTETKAYVDGTTLMLDAKSGDTLESSCDLTGLTKIQKNGLGAAKLTSSASSAIANSVESGKETWSGNIDFSSGSATFTAKAGTELELSGTVNTHDVSGQASGPYVLLQGDGTIRYTGSSWKNDLTKGTTSEALDIRPAHFIFEGAGTHMMGRVGCQSPDIIFRNFGRINSKASGPKSSIWYVEKSDYTTPAHVVVTNGVIDKGTMNILIGASGKNHTGIVLAQKDAAITGVVTVASQGMGVVSVEGGEVMSAGGGIGTSSSGRGYLSVSGGSFRFSGKPVVGKSGRAVIEQTGGLIEETQDWNWLSAGLGDVDVVVSGGTMRPVRAAGCGLQFPDEANRTASADGAFPRQHASFVVSGSGVVDLSNGAFKNGATNGTLIVSLRDGGTLKTRRLTRQFSAAQSKDAKFYVGYDGGVLYTAFNGDFEAGPNGMPLANEVTIYEGGLTVDTSEMVLESAGGSYEVRMTTPFVAPRGKSIKSITLPSSVLNQLYYVPPRVHITGAGVGAAAFVTIDPTSHKPTGVVITNPGTGYDANTTVTVDSWDLASEIACACELEERRSGGLVKRGANTLYLKAVSSFTGGITLEGGSLNVYWDVKAIADGNSLVFKSGKLSLGNQSLVVNRLGGYGQLESGSSAATLSVTGGVDVAVADLVAGRYLELQNQCSPVFGETAALCLTGNLDDLPSGQDFTIMKITGAKTFSGLPKLDASLEGKLKLKLSADGKTISCRRLAGLVITVL